MADGGAGMSGRCGIRRIKGHGTPGPSGRWGTEEAREKGHEGGVEDSGNVWKEQGLETGGGLRRKAPG